jgi:hypothetical protein
MYRLEEKYIGADCFIELFIFPFVSFFHSLTTSIEMTRVKIIHSTFIHIHFIIFFSAPYSWPDYYKSHNSISELSTYNHMHRQYTLQAFLQWIILKTHLFYFLFSLLFEMIKMTIISPSLLFLLDIFFNILLEIR